MDPRCPKCNSKAFLLKKQLLSFALFSVPLLISLPLAVVLYGQAFSFSAKEILIFALVSPLPSFIRLKEKFLCEKCLIEFFSDEVDQSDEAREPYSSKE